MASRLIQVQSKACEASKFVAKHGTSYYRQLVEKNKHYIQEPATVDKCQELSKQLLYTRLASIPGRCETFRKEVDYAKNLWKNRTDLKVEDAGVAALFGLECFAWYCAADKEQGVVLGTTKSKKQNKPKLSVNKSVLKKEFPRMAKAVANQVVDNYYRPDLKKAALARLSVISKGLRVAKSGPKRRNRQA
ncbi:hypothetical protein F2Q70_00033273 [Brassica cretica]|uniref:Ribosomal eL28/Mak16 domain-containing protein n=1 Tax=Brassica cretica TaxID=69181 RepID=A0A8S9FIX8_BRACR|nr:hypothetical protein F2Q70_00033273 [Brassica cretica]